MASPQLIGGLGFAPQLPERQAAVALNSQATGQDQTTAFGLPASGEIQQQDQGPSFSSDPLGSLGLVLRNFAAGFAGQPLPTDQLREDRLRKQALAMQQVSLALNVSDTIGKLPQDQREAFATKFSPMLIQAGVDPSLIKTLAVGGPDLKATLQTVLGDEDLAKTFYTMSGGDQTKAFEIMQSDVGKELINNSHAEAIGAKLTALHNALPQIDPSGQTEAAFADGLTVGEVQLLNGHLPEGIKLTPGELNYLQSPDSKSLRTSLGFQDEELATDLKKVGAEAEVRARIEARYRQGPQQFSKPYLDEDGNRVQENLTTGEIVIKTKAADMKGGDSGASENERYSATLQKYASMEAAGQTLTPDQQRDRDAAAFGLSKVTNTGIVSPPPTLLSGKPQQRPSQTMVGNPVGLVTPGNIDIANRPVAKNPQGGVSTVLSMGIEEDGKEVLIPMVSPDGKILTPKEATALYRSTGQHLGKFSSVDTADAYAEKLHQQQEQLYTSGDVTLPKFTVTQQKPIPPVELANIQGGVAALQALQQMDEGLEAASGIVGGRIGQLGAKTGTNEKAIAFETGSNNMKLAAQAIVKGVPSNFDVQTVINTMAAFGLPLAVNQARMDFTRDTVTNLLKGSIGYYKSVGYQIPDEIVRQAKEYGVDVLSTPAWDGQGDPLQAAIDSADAHRRVGGYGFDDSSEDQ